MKPVFKPQNKIRTWPSTIISKFLFPSVSFCQHQIKNNYQCVIVKHLVKINPISKPQHNSKSSFASQALLT